jgi:CubicO group peptidase (beta-lactamase class C family)
MQAFDRLNDWPVHHASAAVVVLGSSGSPSVHTVGDQHRTYLLASLAKTITSWAILVAVEEGVVSLDTPVGQPGCTMRHLLSHSGGYAFDGAAPISSPGRRRIYSNTGIEIAAEAVAAASGIPFTDYLSEAVLQPLGMSASELRGSPAHQMWSTTDDIVRFLLETIRPTLITADLAHTATHAVFPELAGLVPGVGRYAHCSWGLGFEIKGDKEPHWTGTRNSPDTFGHFGGAGTFMWVDLGAAHDQAIACVALTDRRFSSWATEALVLWPAFSDAVLAEAFG